MTDVKAALQRLREDVNELGTHRSRFTAVRLDMVDDLRALLDAHTEALDALEASPDTGRHTVDVTESPCQCSHCRFVDLSTAVLAKAGRR